jgi:hypothetical protein
MTRRPATSSFTPHVVLAVHTRYTIAWTDPTGLPHYKYYPTEAAALVKLAKLNTIAGVTDLRWQREKIETLTLPEIFR